MTESDIVSTAARTLLAAGYSISGSHRQPHHIEISCERASRLGVILKFVVAITDHDNFTEEQIRDIAHAADANVRTPVLVAASHGPGHLGWNDFLEVLGGAVPSWRALSEEYSSHLITASKNSLPNGLVGEPWLIHEDLVADGLEFVFGRKVQRFGGHRRGQKISDMVAQIPDTSLVVVDAKASSNGFDANWPALRALVEYVERQKDRQNGLLEVIAALIVSSAFLQDTTGLLEVARTFLGETRVALCFMTSPTLAQAIETFRKHPDVRNAVRWNALLTGGLIEPGPIEREIKAAIEERYEPRDV